MYAECVFITYQYLRDQTDMLVVGVIGLQGTGKSTIMSLLSANSPEEDQRLVHHHHPDFVFVTTYLFTFPLHCYCIVITGHMYSEPRRRRSRRELGTRAVESISTSLRRGSSFWIRRSDTHKVTRYRAVFCFRVVS